MSMDLKDAIKEFTAAGGTIVLPPESHLSLAAAAKRLDCSISYLRDHKHEFPNLWRMPGGELRIPERDVEALAKRNKVNRA